MQKLYHESSGSSALRPGAQLPASMATREDALLFDVFEESHDEALQACGKCGKCGQCGQCGQCGECVKGGDDAGVEPTRELILKHLSNHPELRANIALRWNRTNECHITTSSGV